LNVPTPVIKLIADVTTNLFSRTKSLSGIIQEASMDMVIIFPILIVYPHAVGAPNTQIKVETKTPA
jgi:hypothetical protein